VARTGLWIVGSTDRLLVQLPHRGIRGRFRREPPRHRDPCRSMPFAPFRCSIGAETARRNATAAPVAAATWKCCATDHQRPCHPGHLVGERHGHRPARAEPEHAATLSTPCCPSAWRNAGKVGFPSNLQFELLSSVSMFVCPGLGFSDGFMNSLLARLRFSRVVNTPENIAPPPWRKGLEGFSGFFRP
jgi:hypothetical protein